MLVGNPAVQYKFGNQLWSLLVQVSVIVQVHVIIDWCQGRDLVMKVSRFLLEKKSTGLKCGPCMSCVYR